VNNRFRPVNDDHAVEKIQYTLSFQRGFRPSELAEFRRGHIRWTDTLPAMREATALAVVSNGDAGAQAANTTGVEFVLFGPDGSSMWGVRIIGAEITVECFRYSRWSVVWKRSSDYLLSALAVVGEFHEPNSLVEATMLIRNAFVAPLSHPDASELFLPSGLIAAEMLSHSPTWHSHVGWFETIKGERVLHNLNFDALALEEANLAKVTVVHAMTATRYEGADGRGVEARWQWVGSIFDALRTQNERLLERIFVGDIVAQMRASFQE